MAPRRFHLLLSSLVVGITLLGAAAWLLRDRWQAEPVGAEAQRLLAKFHAEGLDYADPAYCVDCHAEETAAWRGSHHHLANAPLKEADWERLLKERGELTRERGMRWKRGDGAPVLVEDGEETRYPVIGSIGLTPLVQYMHLAPDGRLQAHDVAWDPEKEEWFSIFEREEGEPRVRGEWGHWTGQGMNWDANCAYCHMTEYEKGYDVVEDRYNRQWAHMGITCAQCHPGMKTHLSQIRNGNEQWTETLSNEQIMESCAACHSRREELTPHKFRPGDDFEDHFHLALASQLGIYHPDGQVIGENYVFGSLTMSSMGHAGVTCMDCHDPHSHELILPAQNNALCQRCHGSGLDGAPIIEPLAHSRHPAGSTGNQCIECHMPVTYFMGRDGRRDHSFSNPDPRLTLEMGIPNACTECHNDQSVEWSREKAEEWYGADMNAERREKARLVHAIESGEGGSDLAERLRAAIRAEENRFWRASFVGMLPYVPPEPATAELLEEMVRDSDPLVRSSAIRSNGLGWAGEELRRELMEDPSRSVRIAASLVQSGMPAIDDEAASEMRAYLEHTADTVGGALRLSRYWQDRDKEERALPLARRAVDFEPRNPETRRLAAIELHRLGKSFEALEQLEKALAIDPENARVLFNMGLLNVESGDLRAGLRRLREAVEADPQYADAWYNLIVLQWQQNRRAEALRLLGEAERQLPGNPRLRQLRRAFGGGGR